MSLRRSPFTVLHVPLVLFVALVLQVPLARAEDEGAKVEPKPVPAIALSYVDSAQVAEALKGLTSKGIQLVRYGTSASDKPLLALRIGRSDAPTVFVHGGLGDRDAAGTVACLELARRIATSPSIREGVATWVLVPAPNPDALDAFLKGQARPGSKKFDVDRDLDGARGEDGPSDINGDGVITEMRKLDPSGPWAVEEEDKNDEDAGNNGREDLEDKGTDARRDRSYIVFDEGSDDDGDGEVNEDSPGLDLSENMTGYWTHSGPWGGEGPFPGWAPETRALMDFTFNMPSLVAWYGFTSTGNEVLRANACGKINDADAALYKQLAAKFKHRVGLSMIKASDSYEGGNVGSDLDWAGVHLTVPAVRIPVWRLPMKPAPGTSKEPEKATSKDETEKKKKPAKDAKPERFKTWLDWDQAVQGGRGFIPWTPFKHPTLGDVEVGGWKPFTRYEPPVGELTNAVSSVVEAPLVHASFVPRLRVDVEVKARGGGFYDVRAKVFNVGEVATDTASAKKQRRSMGVRLEWTLAEGVSIVGGASHRNVGTIQAGSSSKESHWLVRSTSGQAIGTLQARHRVAGVAKMEVSVQ